MTTPALMPAVPYDPPLINPSPNGLFPAVSWTEDGDQPPRYLGEGVLIRTRNYGGEGSSGVWDAEWCQNPTDPNVKKTGERPDFLDPFEPVTAWAYDQCDPSAYSRQYVQDNAAQWLRLMEQTDVEHALALRMLADAGTPDTASDLVGALGHLEGQLAVSNTVGYIHASAEWAASAAQALLIRYTGAGMLTPMGHRWVFGGGYVNGLGDTLVASSQPYGWRGAANVYTTIEARYNQFVAVAERSFVVGYEAILGAVTITG